MATSNTESQLRRLLSNRLPAVNTAGCHFSLVQGLSGESWRIDSGDVQLLARPQTPEKRMLGVNRRREGQVLKRAGLGIGPKVWLQSSEWLIVEWLAGESVDETAFASLTANGELAELTARLHNRGLSGYRLDLQQQFTRYWKQIDRRRLTPAWLRWQRYFINGTMPRPLQLATLHMDIHAGNLLRQAGQLRLIDWEYAADGDIALELAAMFRFNQFSPAVQQRFLEQYQPHGYADLPQLASQVQRWLPWVDYLMLMWCEVRWQQCRDAEFLRWGAALYQRFCLSSSN
ncbi:TPA: phosphotransferase [Serratia fonticola]|uniref:Thiamine kinase n=1 Tax=Serratia fonticola TaxID=47917 RepID=A0A448SMB6_SERFO|nr:Thiamine kinase [Serratia fonticola]